VEESDGAREESEEVMTKLRMWFLLWVGKVRPLGHCNTINGEHFCIFACK